MKEGIKIGLIFVVFAVLLVGSIFLKGSSEPAPATYYPDLPSSTYSPTSESVRKDSVPAEVEANIQTGRGLGSMTKIEKERITEIITRVIDDTIPVTEVTKKEIQSLFTKYNIADDEIEWLKIYGPAVMTYYQLLYYADAQQSLRTGIPTKDDHRLKLEEFAVSIGKMSTADIKTNDLEMEKVAKKEPFILDGKNIVMTDNLIVALFNSTKAILSRVDLLFEK